MAQINLKDIQRIEKNRNIVHEKVHATYTVFNQMAKSMSSWIHMDVPEERTLKNSVNRFNWIRKQQVF